MDTTLIIILVVAAIVLITIISIYNSLINKRNQVDNIFATIDVLLKKRYDLIPNLVSAVQEYMKHEQGTLTKITELRSRAMDTNLNSDEKVALNNQISQALNGIKVAVENYPELKANQNFIHLQGSINEVEEQISAARRAFNATVTDYNNSVQMFPSNIMAGIMGFKVKQLFQIDETERKNVDVKKLFNS
ncbi:LemA family protein [Candidatus Kapaibacterium sp.]